MDKTTELLARYVMSLGWQDLTSTTVHETKRRIIDTFGCALGGYKSEPAAIARRLAADASATPGARVLVDGRQTTPEMAAFANTVMVRYLDANDSYNSVGSGHPSDMFSAILAAGEASGASGRDLILATLAGYELFAALADQVAIRERGWDQGAFIAPAAAAAAGKLLGLSLEQTGDAIAIAVTANVPTRQTRAGELAMWKGVATAHAAKAGLFAAQLAKGGMTGPTAAFEGHHGIWEQVTGPFALELGPVASSGGGRPKAMERVNLKFHPTEYHSQAPLAMAFAIREKVEAPEIEALNVQTYWVAYSEIGSEPAKWDPRTRETADHSLPYLLAVALVDGRISPASFEPQRFLDPALRPLMHRIKISENKEFTARFPAEFMSEIEVITKSGAHWVERATYPKGHVKNPMSDADIEAKFREFATGVIQPARANAALEVLWRLEDVKRVSEVVDLFGSEEVRK